MTQLISTLLCGFILVVHNASANLNSCPDFAPPKNGHMICDHLLGKYCTPSCNIGYQPESIPAWAYVCNPMTNRWATYPESYPLPWPDCVPKSKMNSREHFILKNVFNPMANETTRRQLSDILLKNNQAVNTKHHSTDHAENITSQPSVVIKTQTKIPDLNSTSSQQTAAMLTNNLTANTKLHIIDHAENITSLQSGVTQTKTNNSDLNDASSHLPDSSLKKYQEVNTKHKPIDHVENVTSQPSMVTPPKINVSDSTAILLQQRSDQLNGKRNMESKVSLTNASTSNINIVKDTENDTLTTTRNNVPLSKIKSRNDIILATNDDQKVKENIPTKSQFKFIKPLALTVNAFKKQYVQYMNENPNAFNTSNFTNFLNEEVYNVTKLGEEAFNNSVMAVWGEYYKNFYKTYASESAEKTALRNQNSAEVVDKGESDAVSNKPTSTSTDPSTSSSTTPSSTTSSSTTSLDVVPINKSTNSTTKDQLSSTSKNTTTNVLLSSKNNTTKNPMPPLTNPSSSSAKTTDSSSSKEKPLGVVVVVVGDTNKTEGTVESVLSSDKLLERDEDDKNVNTKDAEMFSEMLKKKVKTKNADPANNSTIINININNININITDASEAAGVNGNKVDGLYGLTDTAKIKDGATPSEAISRKASLKTHKEKRKNNKKKKQKEDKKELKNIASNFPTTTTTATTTSTSTTSKITSSTSTAASSLEKSNSNKDLNSETLKKNDSINNSSMKSQTSEKITSKKPNVRTFIKEGGQIKEVPNVTARFIMQRNGDTPLVPVFSDKDLSLLRHMVDEPIPVSNTKRSELQRSVSSLWTKMLRLSSNREGQPFQIPKLSSRKDLAKKDSSLAELIMTNVNGNQGYHFQQTVNPFLNGQFENLMKTSKFREANPSARQYVWNGATYVPASGMSGPLSYLNSDTGGGLSTDSRYRWNGATYVPNEKYADDNIEPQNTTPMSDEKQPETKQPENNPEQDSKLFTDAEAANTEAQNVLNSWNEPPDRVLNKNNTPDKKNDSPEEKPDEKSNEEYNFFYWDGSKFAQITASSSSHLAPKEIIYKLGPSGMQAINFNISAQGGAGEITKIFMPPKPSVESPTPKEVVETNEPDPLTSRWDGTKFVPVKDSKNTEIGPPEVLLTTQSPQIEHILQTNYPQKPLSLQDINNINDKEVAGDPVNESIPKAFTGNTNNKTSSTLPTSRQIKNKNAGQDDINANAKLTTSSTLPPYISQASTTAVTITTTTISPVSKTSFLTSSTVAPEYTTLPTTVTPSYTTTTTTTTPAPQLSPASIVLNQTSHDNDASNGTNEEKTKDYTQTVPKVNPDPKNPYREDDENLENVIESDLNLKQAIESLSQIYENSSDSTPVSFSGTHDNKVIEASLPVGQQLIPTKNPNIEQELNSDLSKNQLDVPTAEKDIEVADKLLRKEENGQPFSVPTAVVKTNENENPKSDQLKAILQNEVHPTSVETKPEDLAKVLEKSIADTQVSYSKLTENSQAELAANASTLPGPEINNKSNDPNFLTSLSGNTKNVLEQTLQNDILKLETGKIGEESDADLLTLATTTTESPLSDAEKDEPLSVADIRALLQLTRLAEKESTSKKHGLPYPRLTRERALRLLRKPSIKHLVKLLVRKRLSPRIISLLKQRRMMDLKRTLLNKLSKQMIDKKRSEALKKLVTIWNKKYQYLRTRNNTYEANKVNPLPKFAG